MNELTEAEIQRLTAPLRENLRKARALVIERVLTQFHDGFLTHREAYTKLMDLFGDDK